MRPPLCLLTILCLLPAGIAAAQVPTTLPSYAEPSISPDGSEIAFSSGGDLWTVPAAGGTATILVTHPAYESRPLYAPDGKRLAFLSTRTGNGDVYLFTFDTGEVKRLTFDDGREELDGFSADGRWVYFSTTSQDVGNSNRDIYRVSVEGGTPMPIVADRFANEFQAAPRPDGSALAFVSGGIMAREWYRKGHAHAGESQIVLMRPGDAAPTFQPLTPDGSRDLWPMWSQDGRTIYYVSDRDGPQNLWQRDSDAEPLSAGKPLTRFTAGRVAWPSITRDGATIVFERGFAIWKVDTRTGRATEVPIHLRGATAGTATVRENFGGSLGEIALSPDGRKLAFTAHGRAFAVAARDGGDALPLTHAGTASHVTWAHDSKRVAYVCDRDGPRHLYLYDFVTGRELRLTRGADNDSVPTFSPDDTLLAFQRNGSELRALDLRTNKERSLAVGQGFEREPFDRGPSPYVFSPQGDWIAFNSVGRKGFSNAWVVPTDGRGVPRQVTFIGNAYARSVSWSPDGTFLLYGTGQRTEDNQLAKIDLILRTPHFREDQLRDLFREVPRPTLPRPTQPNDPASHPPTTSPTTGPTASPLAALDPTTRPTAAPTTSPTKIVFEDIRQRMSLLPVGVDVDAQTISPDGKTALLVATTGGQQNLYAYSLDDSSTAPAVAKQLTSTSSGKGHAQFSPDGREVFYLDGGRVTAITLATRDARTINVNADLAVDFDAEKLLVFHQAWAYVYDNFFDPKFTGVDWLAVRDAYRPRVAGTKTPDELRRVLALMLGEINASHLGIYQATATARPTTGRLAVRWDARDYDRTGRLRVAEVLPLGPAAVAGVKVGEYVVAVDGVRIGQHSNLDEMLNLKVNRRVTLKVAPGPSRAAELFARDVPLLPIDTAAEKALLYRAWVESRRALVDKASGGRLGYVHLSDMSESALARLNTDLDAETQQKDGVVVDVRGNTGGFVNGFAVDVFARRNYLTMRRRGFAPAPGRVLLGQRALLAPTILVTNRSTYSDGEDFTEGYRALGLGKTVGEPTGGSVIFTSTVNLLDGTRLGLPTTAVLDGRNQTLERHPRPVDLAVSRPVGEWYTGQDAQLTAAATELLKEVDAARATPTTAPTATTRSAAKLGTDGK